MSQIKVGCLTLGMLENNTYFLHKEGEYDCIIIDPARDGEMIVTKLREKGLTIKAIFLTHAHFDHILGVEGIRKLTNAPIYGGKDDVEGFLDPSINQSVKINRQISIRLDHELEDGDEITVGNMTCKVIATPGHTPGGVCFYFKEDNILFSGDTLFFETYGRTDFENGSAGDMQRSVQRLLELPEETKVYPGHNDFTTIEHERKYNPLSVNY
ncbi:MAG: MBL fold metallo-hydrolase [Lachnospiraceae bacterium]|nr:MBL fold metallo-hydrolase [Lachnospiraceae bacterium]